MSLTFNIVPFSYPESTKDFYFTTEKQEGSYPLKNYKLPANAREILEVEDLEKDIRELFSKKRAKPKQSASAQPLALVSQGQALRVLNEKYPPCG